jgi:hypothetical protein
VHTQEGETEGALQEEAADRAARIEAEDEDEKMQKINNLLKMIEAQVGHYHTITQKRFCQKQKV